MSPELPAAECDARTESSQRCAAGCSHCPLDGEEVAAGMRGGSFALAAAAYFILPLALAFAGAAAGGSSPTEQLFGGTVGLGAGMVAAAALARAKHRTDPS